MNFEIKQKGRYKYVEEGEGEPLVLLHGLFGALSNFTDLISHFRNKYKVVVPLLPLYDLKQLDTSVKGFAKYLNRFVDYMGYKQFHLLGNSLGGHISLLFVLKHPKKAKTLILTGSSGLFENGMGETYPKRGDYEYIKKKAELTFYDPEIATKELVDEVFEITNNRLKAIRVIWLAKSAIRHNLGEEIKNIKLPTLLIWGQNDTVTPPMVGEEFHRLMPNSELYFVNHCGHAPMMEVPREFNMILENFLSKHSENNES